MKTFMSCTCEWQLVKIHGILKKDHVRRQRKKWCSNCKTKIKAKKK